MGGRAFSYQAPLLWNQLPVWVQEADTLSTWNIRLKTSFLIKLIVGPRLLGNLPWCTFLQSALFTLCVHKTLLLSLACVSLSKQVSLTWCCGACCPLFPVLWTPSWSRRMAPFLSLVVSVFLPVFVKFLFSCLYLMDARDGMIKSKRSTDAICWFPGIIFFNSMTWINLDFNEFDLMGLLYYNEMYYNWLELNCIEVPWDNICCDLVLYKTNWIGGRNIRSLESRDVCYW